MTGHGQSDRPSDHVESSHQTPPEPRRSETDKTDDFSRVVHRGSRLSRRRLWELVDELSERDRSVLAALRRVRVLSGSQLERLAFDGIADSARGRVRRRVLGRLVGLGLVATLERRVGGVRAGSAGLVYVLTAAGHRLLDLCEERATEIPVRRRPAHTPGQLFLAHMLAVSEVYVGLVEAARGGGWTLVDFAVEADARWPLGDGSLLRPDALVVLGAGEVEDVWWLEVDRGTESLPRLKTMLDRYLVFAQSGAAAPYGVVPRVLVSVDSEQRLRRLRGLLRRLPEPAGELFVGCRDADAVRLLVAGIESVLPREPP